MAESFTPRRISREERSRVLKFNDKSFEKLEEYEYSPLKDQKRRIRLLRLISSGLENPLIDCELFEVEFNEKYIPVRVHPGMDSGSDDRVDYEALSWCWGKDSPEYAIRIRDEDDVQYKMPAKRELLLALKYLRRPHRDRIIWIDAICIDQANDQERNHQVQMMSMIYTRSHKVCVWLGEDDSDSNMAITFITNEIMHLERFDSICKNKANADKWQALLTLMQRPWFRRRWVVQEIALSRRAKVYCGGDKISWKDFAVAVELFVEVESATHRLSEVMQKDERFFHVPGWFEYVSQLGASLLVDATGKVFRATETGKDDSKEDRRRRLPSGILIPESLQLRKSGSSPKVQKVGGKGSGKAPPSQSNTNGKSGRPASGYDSPEKDPGNGGPATGSNRTASKVAVDTPHPTFDRAETLVPGQEPRGMRLANDRTKHTTEETSTEGVTVDPLGRRGLLSLEYLVSTLSTFEATEPRDAIYSLLAISRDTTPFAEAGAYRSYKSRASLVMNTLSSFLERKPYRVDYSLPYSDVCKDFIAFCIERSEARDPSRALDILCRPWAPPPPKDDFESMMPKSLKAKKNRARKKNKSADTTGRMPTWRVAEKQGKGVYHDGARVELRRASRKPTKLDENDQRVPDDRDMDKYREEVLMGEISPFVLKYFPERPQEGEDMDRPEHDIDLPSWVRSIEGAPFSPFKHPGMHILKTGRKNADSLVGLPQDGHRNYSAAQTHKAEDQKFKLDFKKRPVLGHYSLYVKGFVLDQVAEVASPAHGGNIPKAWTILGKWDDLTTDPPDDFLRTLVADRGKGNRNPPYYYAKACRESVSKGSIESGRVNMEALINSEQNSIITEFCRRVHEVIWNRRLIRTKLGTLGLASEHVRPGDLVCIIYGCSVPVILRRFMKATMKMEVAKRDVPSRGQSDRSKSRKEGKPQNEELKIFSDALSKLEDLGFATKQTNPGKLNGTGSKQGEETDGKDDKVMLEEMKEAVKAMKSVWPKLQDRMRSQEDWVEEARKRALEEALREEGEEDKIEKVKAMIRNFEMSLVQKARYKELCGPGGFHNKETHFNGADYQKYIKTATEIANKHLKKLKEIEEKKARVEREAAEELAIETEKLQPKKKEEDSLLEKPFNDKHYFYSHMGESYIHGMMDGEAIRERFRLKLSETVFELR